MVAAAPAGPARTYAASVDFAGAFWPALLPAAILVALILCGDQFVRWVARQLDRDLSDADVARHKRFNIGMTSVVLMGFLVLGVMELTA